MKLMLIAIILFTAIDEGVFRVLNISIHPSPTLTALSIVANVTMYAIYKACCYRRELNEAEVTMWHLDQQLINNDVAGARLSDGSYIPLQVVVEADDAAQYEYSSTNYDVYAGGSDHDDHKIIPAWVIKMERLTDAGISAEDALKAVEFDRNFCSSFHVQGCNCQDEN